MQDLLLQLANLAPGVMLAIIAIYYYMKKKIPGLLWMAIAYVVLALITVAFYYMPTYISSHAMPMEEANTLYTRIGSVSIVANIAMLIGLIILLERYPTGKRDVLHEQR